MEEFVEKKSSDNRTQVKTRRIAKGCFRGRSGKEKGKALIEEFFLVNEKEKVFSQVNMTELPATLRGRRWRIANDLQI